MTAVILQFVATLATAVASILAFGTIKEGRRFTRLGRMLLIAIGIGTLSSAGALIVGSFSEEKRRENETLEAIERTEGVVKEVRRAIYLLDDLTSAYSFTVPKENPAIAPYFQRISQGLDSALSQGYPFTDARGIAAVFSFEPPIVGFRPYSPWGPTQPGEELAMSTLGTGAISILFFGSSIKASSPDLDRPHHSADLVVGGTTRSTRLVGGRPRLPQLLVYSYDSKELTVRTAPPIELEEINHVASGRVVSFLDLAGAEMHVILESGVLTGNDNGNLHRDELNKALRLESFSLRGRGIGFSLEGKDFELHSHAQDRPCFVFRFPKDLEAFYETS